MAFSNFFFKEIIYFFISPFRNMLVFSNAFSDGYGQGLGEGAVPAGSSWVAGKMHGNHIVAASSSAKLHWYISFFESRTLTFLFYCGCLWFHMIIYTMIKMGDE